MTNTTIPRARRGSAGFTLAELLLASILGAMLLSAISVGTFGFAMTLNHLEEKASIDSDVDPVLRLLTRDIREAWWAESVDIDHIQLADPEGQITEYFLDEDDQLVLRRDNGDEGVLLTGIESLSFAPTFAERLREGDPVDHDGTWYTSPSSAAPALPVPLPVGGAVSLAFVAPVRSSDVPALGVADQQVLALDIDVLRVPVAWIAGSEAQDMTVAIYESWGPGSAKPLGSPVASLTVPGSSLPAAVWNGAYWDLPASSVSIGLSLLGVDLEPGVGYAAVLSAGGDARLLVKAHPYLGGPSSDDLAIQNAPGESFVDQPLLVPFEVSGDYTITGTTSHQVVMLYSIDLTVYGRPAQQRSAALLSQRVSSDPWLGVVPGELADF